MKCHVFLVFWNRGDVKLFYCLYAWPILHTHNVIQAKFSIDTRKAQCLQKKCAASWEINVHLWDDTGCLVDSSYLYYGTVAAQGFPFSEFPNHLWISQVALLGVGLTRRKVSALSSSDENRFGLDGPHSRLPYVKEKNRRSKVGRTWHWGSFVQPLL